MIEGISAGHGVRGALPVGRAGAPGADQRPADPAGVGAGAGGRGKLAAHRGVEPAPQAGRGRPQPQVHLHRVPGGVLDAGGGREGRGHYSRGIAALREVLVRPRSGFGSTGQRYPIFKVDSITGKSSSERRFSSVRRPFQ